jgi:hypothetical protein
MMLGRRQVLFQPLTFHGREYQRSFSGKTIVFAAPNAPVRGGRQKARAETAGPSRLFIGDLELLDFATAEPRPRGHVLETMTAVHDTWEVLPHGPVTLIDDGILTVTGAIPLPLVELERRMTVVRLADGSTVIYSAVALDEEAMRRIEALGPPRTLVVPGDAHRLDAKIYKERYPQLRVLTPPGARARVEKALPVDATEGNFGDPDVTWHVVAGSGGHEAALLVRRASGTTLIVSDLIANLRRKEGFEGWMLHLMGFGNDAPQVPTVERVLMVESKAQLRRQFLDWAQIPDLRRIIMSHGKPIEHGAAQALTDLAATLA